ncbi:MAG: VOC family protein [Acidimicrobiales bacterium]|jgi:methylmalonyl-CoA/ethylmalonyl-CoA epimerase
MPDRLRGIHATFDHVAHATRSIKSLVPIYRDLLGGEFIGGGESPRVGFRSVQLRFEGGGKIELLEQMEGSDFLESFFRRVGDGGLHHITYKVPDINEALLAARAAGMAPFGVHLEDAFWQEFFLHPRTTGGALIQLAHATFEIGVEQGPRMSLEEFLENPTNYWRE